MSNSRFFSIPALGFLGLCLLPVLTGCTSTTFYDKRNEALTAKYESRLPGALKLAREAKEIARQDVVRKPDDPNTRFSLMSVCALEGDTLYQMGQIDQAAACYEEGLKQARKFCDDYPSSIDARSMKASFLLKMGIVHMRRKEDKKGVDSFIKANNMMEQVVREEGGGRTAAISALVEGRSTLGYTYLSVDCPDKAMPLFKKNLTERKNLAEKCVYSPGGGAETNWEYANAQADVASAYKELGDAWMYQNQFKKALDCYEKGAELLRFIGDTAPDNLFFRAAIERSYEGLAEAYLEMKQPAKALKFFEERLKINRYIHDSGLGWETSTQYDLAVALWDLGRGYMAMKDRGKAKQAFEESLAISNRLNRKYPEKIKFRELAESSRLEMKKELAS